MKIFITGGTGFIGGHLVRHLLDRGDSVVIATRSPEKYQDDNSGKKRQSDKEQKPGKSDSQGKSDGPGESDNSGMGQEQGKRDNPVRYVSIEGNLPELMEGCDAVVNLAGESLFGKRWTAGVKRRLYDSRIRTTRKLVDAMREMDSKPALLLSGSAVGYYGDCGSDKITEKRSAGNDFLAGLSRDWEQAAMEAEHIGVRVVIPRIGVALGTEGGALATMLPVFRAFLGGSIGSGEQYFPWIHVDDLCLSFLYAMDDDTITGPYNASSPNPVTMDDFSKALGDTLSRPSIFRVPEFGLNMVLGEAAIMITTSLRVIPEKITDNGFRFNHEQVGEALRDLLKD